MDEKELRLKCFELAVTAARLPEFPRDPVGVANQAESFYTSIVKSSTDSKNSNTLGLKKPTPQKGQVDFR